MTVGVELGEPLDVDFQYEGYDAVEIANVKIMAIGVDDIHFRDV